MKFGLKKSATIGGVQVRRTKNGVTVGKNFGPVRASQHVDLRPNSASAKEPKPSPRDQMIDFWLAELSKYQAKADAGHPRAHRAVARCEKKLAALGYQSDESAQNG